MGNNFNFDSRPDSRNRITRVAVDGDKAAITLISLIENNQTLTSVQPLAISLFKIRFTPYDLRNSPNKRLPGAVEYSITSASPQIVPSLNMPPAPDGSRAVTYQAAATQVEGLPGPFDPISVTITFKAPASQADAGWIDLDIQYTYPSQFFSGDFNKAWESRLIYPQLCFDSAMAKDYFVLDPIGRVGNFVNLASAEPAQAVKVQFAALYKTVSGAGGMNAAEGFALSATDEAGNHKELHYGPFPGDSTKRVLSFQLLSPIHLKNGAYVRPASYTLSGGDEYEFGGGRMHFRIRALRVEAACPGAPIDWFDVASVYREWVRSRTATIYRRFVPSQNNGPLEDMSPFTVVINYGLDGQIGKFEGGPNLRRWLEIHPVLDGAPDMPGNTNDSLAFVLKRLKDRFGLADLNLEAQIWGFEMGGFYRFLGGFPPATNVINTTGQNNFRNSMDQLTAAGIIPIITTDPLSTNFNRERFRGHLLPSGPTWVDAIPNDFPDTVKGATCALTWTKDNERYFHVLPPNIFSGKPNCTAASTMAAAGKLDSAGALLIGKDALTRFNGIENRRICPTVEIERLYLDTWLRDGVFFFGSRLIEFMKHHYGWYFCFDKVHRHIVPPVQNRAYDNLIGYGSWYVTRIKSIWTQLQLLRQSSPPFALAHEHLAPEALVPYYDEFYEYDFSSLRVYYGDTRSQPLLEDPGSVRAAALYHYVYSPLVSHKMNLADTDHQIHPGYREKRNSAARVQAAYFLHADRDKPTDNPDFAKWKSESEKYFNDNFTIAEDGIAPRGYPTKPPGTYDYRRTVQNVFNLRSQIFRLGMAAVQGERILVPEVWLEEPSDAYEEAINMAVRAVHLQVRFKAFFRGGAMLGQTRLFGGNSAVTAWRAHRRSFIDVKVLVDSLYPDANERTGLLGAMDFISRGVDREVITPVYTPMAPLAYADGDTRMAVRIVTDKIHHMIWQRDLESGRRNLYTFANVGNSDQPVEFLFGRGLEGGAQWKTTVFTFRGTPDGEPTPGSPAVNGDRRTITIPKRSLLAVLLFQ